MLIISLDKTSNKTTLKLLSSTCRHKWTCVICLSFLVSSIPVVSRLATFFPWQCSSQVFNLMGVFCYLRQSKSRFPRACVYLDALKPLQTSQKDPAGIIYIGVMDDEAQDSECPVCYENLSESVRTLSCGHHFCHDCLVRTLLNANLNGSIQRDNIICPVCRHLTFITKLHGFTASVAEAKNTGKTLEVPSVPTTAVLSRNAGRSQGGGCICTCLRKITCRPCKRRLICPKDSSDVFIISESGRPMEESDVIDIGTTSAMQHSYSRGPRICTISCCLLILMITFTLLALVAATIPWVLLAWAMWHFYWIHVEPSVRSTMKPVMVHFCEITGFTPCKCFKNSYLWDHFQGLFWHAFEWLSYRTWRRSYYCYIYLILDMFIII